jgi:hypothetical protein
MNGFLSRKWTLTAGTFLLIGCLLLLRLYFYRHQAKLHSYVGPLVLAAGEKLVYVDSSTAATTWRWEFGEGSVSTRPRGTFHYRHAGTYLVRLTVNNKLRQLFKVQVKQPLAHISALRLVGPSEGYQDEKLAFQAYGGNVHSYAWRFGESHRVDATEPAAIYAYTTPGTYQVQLRTDDGTTLRHTVRIVPRNEALAPAPASAMLPADNIRWRLQRIANGKQVNRQYQYLLTRYLCGQANVPVVAGDLPPRDFYTYCMSLQFDPGWTIDSVALTPALSPSCVGKLVIMQHKSE